MSFWTSIRDAVESVASVAGNYFLPGSSLITSHLVSQGAQDNLNSGLGQLAQLGSGFAGGTAGNLTNYGTGLQALGVDTSGISNFVGPSLSNTFGLGIPTTAMPGLAGSALGGMDTAQTFGANVGSFTGGGSSMFGVDPAATSTAFGTGMGTGTYGVDPSLLSQQALQGTSMFDSAAQAAQRKNPFALGSPLNLLQSASGLWGLVQGQQQQNMAQQQLARQQQLAGAVPLPTAQNVQNLPGYQAGMDAVQRSMAAQGYQGSGNMMAALQNYGQQAYQQAMGNYQTQQQVANQNAAVPGQSRQQGINTQAGGLGNLVMGQYLSQMGGQ